MEGRKTLIASTVAVALVLFGIAATYQVFHPPVPISISGKGFPTVGKSSAPIEIVLIEDFQCRNCRAFSQKIIPRIQSEYIRTGRARFTLVPVSFLLGSQAIANAALEVHRQRPDRFFPYLKEILNHEGDVKKKDLIRLARRMGGVDIEKLRECVEKGCHSQELEQNLNWAMGIMGSHFRTPALYINGAPGSTFSFEAIQFQVDQILRKKS